MHWSTGTAAVPCWWWHSFTGPPCPVSLGLSCGFGVSLSALAGICPLLCSALYCRAIPSHRALQTEELFTNSVCLGLDRMGTCSGSVNLPEHLSTNSWQNRNTSSHSCFNENNQHIPVCVFSISVFSFKMHLHTFFTGILLQIFNEHHRKCNIECIWLFFNKLFPRHHTYGYTFTHK